MQSSPLTWRTALLVLWLSACSTDRDTPGDAGAGGADAGDDGRVPEDFCSEFLSALCDHLEQCGCQPDDIEECRESLAKCAQPSPFDARGLLERGEVKFDAKAWAQLRARWKDPKSACDAPFTDLGLDSVAVFSLGGSFTGTLEPGAPCALPVGQHGGINSCKAGALCLEDEAGASRCTLIARRGEACDRGPSPRRVCFDQRAPDNDDEFESAFDFLICVPASPGASTGTCRAELELGADCNMDESCKSSFCDWGDGDAEIGKCAVKRADGAACDWYSECAAGGCNNGRCGPPGAEGGACEFDPFCASQTCYQPDEPLASMPGKCGPKLDKPRGASCSRSYECASRVCAGGTCLNPICG